MGQELRHGQGLLFDMCHVFLWSGPKLPRQVFEEAECLLRAMSSLHEEQQREGREWSFSKGWYSASCRTASTSAVEGQAQHANSVHSRGPSEH